jgi:ATPase subunit of ABC transporter with duplicated ATPase domains
MISFKHVYKEIPSGLLLEDITFTLGNREKVGLIGQNGCGKSTLFKLLVGEEPYDSGQITVQGERLAYLPQLFELPADTSVREYGRKVVSLDDRDYYAFEKHLSRFRFGDVQLDTRVDQLSSGQMMKVKIAELLLMDPTVLVMDEPTNHLDIDGILWMEEFVKEFEGIVVMVSHDRSFLDNTTNQIFEIDEKKLHIFVGGYTDYVMQKEHWVSERQKSYRRQEKKRQQLERLIENSRKIAGGKARGKAVRSAKKRMEREVLRHEIQQYQRSVIQEVDFHGTTHTGKLMMRLQNVFHAYGQKNVLDSIDFELRGKERVWLFGPNGSGKSTLLNIITGQLLPSGGIVEIGQSVRWGYFRQNQEHLPLEETVESFFTEQTGISGQKLPGVLRKYLFTPSYFNRRIKNLSPGERARLAFAVFAQQELDLLILDEPTNHLDIWTKEAIERSLQEYTGALLLVSHDRYFVEQVGVDRVVTISSGALIEVY